MSLLLKVLSFKNKPITEIDAVSIGINGGSIGRSDDNALVLPDTEKFVSRHHATISVENGCYYLSDTSLSGVYINGQEPPLNNATERIVNGTILRIGEYEIAVAIVDEPVIDDFPFANESITSEPNAFLQGDEPPLAWEETRSNSLMSDNFPSHEELVQTKSNEHHDAFTSGLPGNHSPLYDSYIAPGITQPSPVEEIPENLNFDDFFSDHNLEIKTDSQPIQPVNQPTVDGDFEALLGAAISDITAEREQPTVKSDILAENNQEPGELADVVASDNLAIDQSANQLLHSSPAESAGTLPETNNNEDNKTKREEALLTESPIQKMAQAQPDSVLFNAFLQGAAVKCNEIRHGQQAETLHRIGQMFRKLIDGTVAVLRSRAEFKSLCRVNMTVIRAANNNPLKFTVSTDDVLRQLIENKTDGFLSPTAAIEEGFNDIMNHQLAMQAGIQASLTDLLKTFDPKIIEKQFEQGIVLQKKAKCWDRYEETYRNTVEDAVENFFGEEFVKAYEKQMNLLTKPGRK